VGRHLAIGIYVVALVATMVGVDILVFRHNVWARLLANVGILLGFASDRCSHLGGPLSEGLSTQAV
jgi:predicted cobalt transporter CbtA